MTSRKETTEASAPKGAPRKAASPDQSLMQRPNSTAVGHSELPADGKGHQTLTRESLSQGREKPKRNQHSRAQKLNLCGKKTFRKKRELHTLKDTKDPRNEISMASKRNLREHQKLWNLKKLSANLKLKGRIGR